MNYKPIIVAAGVILLCGGRAFAQSSDGLTHIIADNGGNPPASPQFVAGLRQEEQLERRTEDAFNAGKFVLAESDARKALANGALMKDHIRIILASSLLGQNKTKEALSEYANVLQSQTSSRPETLQFALAFVRNHEWKKALALYNEAIPFVGGGDIMNGTDFLAEDNDFSADTPEPEALEADIHLALGMSDLDDFGRRVGSAEDVGEFRDAIRLEPDSEIAKLFYASGLAEAGKSVDATTAILDVINNSTDDVKAEAEEEYKTDPGYIH